MFEFVYEELTTEQKDAYLERIGCQGIRELSRQTLDTLVYQHQCTVPFEDLEVVAGVPDLPLDGEALFEKIVERRRGGFCFELNGLFVLLLRAMGFDAYSCMCRVAANRPVLGGLFHRACLVRLDGRMYLCDVGMGGPMAPFAVEVSETRQTRHGETYWIEPTYEGWYLQKRLTSQGTEGNVIIFAPQPFLPMDFVPLCRALISSPATLFRTTRMVNLRTERGNINIRGDVLTVTENGEHRERTFTEEEFPEILKTHFHMEV